MPPGLGGAGLSVVQCVRYSGLMASQRSGRGREQFTVSSGILEVSWHGSHATVFLDGVESSHINVDRPQDLEFEYMQHMDIVCAVFCGAQTPIRALHLGGAANALPWAWSITHPRSRQTVVEIDELMITTVRQLFALPRSPELKIRCDDGRRSLDSARPGAWDLIVRDAFSAGTVPAHLSTYEAAASAARALRPGGVYLVNSAHGGGADAREEVDALLDAFPLVFAIADPKVGKGGRRGNVVFAGITDPSIDTEESVNTPRTREQIANELAEQVKECDRLLRRLPLPARIMETSELRRWQAGRRSMTDEQVGWS